jgi:protein gp37
MSTKTGIEWTDATWNPIRGCSRVSEGCRHCYAETVAGRFGGAGLPYEGLTQITNGHAVWNGQIKFVEEHLLDPLKWKGKPIYDADGKKVGYRPGLRIFVNSMSDLFHENVTDEMRDRIFAVMALAPQHTFQVLTKRPERMLAYLTADYRETEVQAEITSLYLQEEPPRLPHLPNGWGGLPLRNVWLGVSVENQAAADERIPLLLQTPAAVRFISAEPLLGPIDLFCSLPSATYPVPWDVAGGPKMCAHGYAAGIPCPECPKLDWVICGGESSSSGASGFPGSRMVDRLNGSRKRANSWTAMRSPM